MTRTRRLGPADLTGHAVLAVFAHPDDESIACGGLLAWCARGGARVALVCATHGELGRPAGGAGQQGESPGIASSPALAESRSLELEDAASALGLDEVRLLGFPDGMLPWLSEGALEAAIRSVIDALRPDVVVTFGADGLYWHPDHIAVHEAVRAAVVSLAGAAPALFYVTMPEGQMRGVVEAAAVRVASGDAPPLARADVLGIDNPEAFGAAAQLPSLVLEVGPFAANKLAAIRSHRTQTAGGPFDAIADADAAVLLGREHYHRADVGSQAPAFIERLSDADIMERS